MGLTQGILAALVADAVPADRRGTAFGIFNLAGGVAALLASLLAGFLWSRHGAPSAFLAGAGLTFAALIGTGLLRRRRIARES
jgi:MFS family permease